MFVQIWNMQKNNFLKMYITIELNSITTQKSLIFINDFYDI